MDRSSYDDPSGVLEARGGDADLSRLTFDWLSDHPTIGGQIATSLLTRLVRLPAIEQRRHEGVAEASDRGRPLSRT